MKLKIGDVVTVPVRDELKEWAGQVGIIVEEIKGAKKKKQLAGCDYLVLVASSIDEKRSSVWMFKKEDLKPGGNASDLLVKMALERIKSVEEYKKQQEFIEHAEQFVEESIQRLMKHPKIVTKESSVPGFLGSIPTYIFYLKDEKLIEIPQKGFHVGYYEWMTKVMERVNGL